MHISPSKEKERVERGRERLERGDRERERIKEREEKLRPASLFCRCYVFLDGGCRCNVSLSQFKGETKRETEKETRGERGTERGEREIQIPRAHCCCLSRGFCSLSLRSNWTIDWIELLPKSTLLKIISSLSHS